MAYRRKSNHRFALQDNGTGRLIPEGSGDRYWAQDMSRDIMYLRSMVGEMMTSLLYNEKKILYGTVTQGSDSTHVNVGPCAGFARIPVVTTDDDAVFAVPPMNKTELIDTMVRCDGQNGIALPTSTGFIKIVYNETTVNTRDRHYTGGNYAYVIAEGATIVCDGVDANNDVGEVLIAKWSGAGTDLKITMELSWKDTTNRRFNNLESIGGYIAAHDFGTATPADQAITDYALTQIPEAHDYTEIFNGTRVKNIYNNHLWILTNDIPRGGTVFDWVDNGVDPTGAVATNSTFGIVKGTNLGLNGEVQIDNGAPFVNLAGNTRSGVVRGVENSLTGEASIESGRIIHRAVGAIPGGLGLFKQQVINGIIFSESPYIDVDGSGILINKLLYKSSIRYIFKLTTNFNVLPTHFYYVMLVGGAGGGGGGSNNICGSGGDGGAVRIIYLYNTNNSSITLSIIMGNGGNGGSGNSGTGGTGGGNGGSTALYLGSNLIVNTETSFGGGAGGGIANIGGKGYALGGGGGGGVSLAGPGIYESSIVSNYASIYRVAGGNGGNVSGSYGLPGGGSNGGVPANGVYSGGGGGNNVKYIDGVLCSGGGINGADGLGLGCGGAGGMGGVGGGDGDLGGGGGGGGNSGAVGGMGGNGFAIVIGAD